MNIRWSGRVSTAVALVVVSCWLHVPLGFADIGNLTLAGSATPIAPLSVKLFSSNKAREGYSYTATGRVYGGSGSYSYNWDFDGDGVFESLGRTRKFTPSDNGSYSITLKAVDLVTNQETSASKTILVINVAPRITFAPVRRTRGSALVSLNASARDGAADLSAGLTFHWNFGDGSVVDVDGSGNISRVEHSFTSKGRYRIRVKATDKDGITSSTVLRSVVILSSDLAPAVALRPPTQLATNDLPIPQRTLWEEHMLTYGRESCERIKNSSLSDDERLSAIYYDAQWVFYQIHDYTNDPYWNDCAFRAGNVYRDKYVIPNGGKVPGFWNFTHGLVAEYLRSGNSASRSAAILLSQQAAYARDETPLAWTTDSTLSREVAYAIMSYINAETLGQPRRGRMAALADQALDHINQWFVARNVPWVRPFMVGLTAHALMSYYETVQDPRIIPALTLAADKLWDTLWLPNSEAFRYTDRLVNAGDLDPAPDLNPLIAPMYAWLYHQTGQSRFLERGDQIFAGGVKNAWMGNSKQFNQSYRLSFEYVRLRSLAPINQ